MRGVRFQNVAAGVTSVTTFPGQRPDASTSGFVSSASSSR
jgi:hypothetical protein